VFPSGGCPAKMQTRGKTAFAFGKANVFANSSATTPNVIIGRASNPAGILDLNGYDQSVPTITFTAPENAGRLESFADYNYFISDDAATLTVTRSFAGTGIFYGMLKGGLSFRLNSANNGTASFSNIVDQVSSTTGSLICAAGTIKLLNGARFDSLTSIRKEGTGNFEISTPVINSSADLYLDGTGKITLNNDISVAHAYTNDTNGGWVMLKADEYDATTLGDHLAGIGKVTVMYDDSGSGETVTYTWTGALGNGTLSDGGNWVGGEAPTLDSASEFLVFPATGTSSFRVDGAITVGGIEIAYPGAFTVEAGTGAQINLGEGGLSVADTTAQTNTVTLGAPIRLQNGIADVTFSVGDGTALDIAGGLSATAAYGRRLVIDGGALTFGGASSGLLVEMVVTNAASVTVTSASGLGAVGATIYGDLPYFSGTRTCTSPWAVVGPFPSSLTGRLIYPKIDGSPFEFTGAVRLEGTLKTAQGEGFKYTGYASLAIANDTTFRGGIRIGNLARLVLNIGKDVTLSILENPMVRGENSDYNLGYTDVRFYGSGATNSFVVTDQSLDSDNVGVYVSQCSLVCAADHCISGQFTPYVNSRDPASGDPIWGRFDLAGHSQTIMRFNAVTDVIADKYSRYPDSYVEVTSATPADLVFGKAGNPSALHQLKFTGAVSLRTASPWTAALRITNTVSTTTGDLAITSGTVEFLKDAGWGGGTNVTVSGTGVLRINEGAKGFAPVGGGASKVQLSLAGGGSLDIPNAATVVSVRTCETNGVRLSRGDYTAATLPGFLSGEGTLHVRMMYGNGTIFCVR